MIAMEEGTFEEEGIFEKNYMYYVAMVIDWKVNEKITREMIEKNLQQMWNLVRLFLVSSLLR